MSEPVILTRTDRRGVATVVFNRPDVGNAYNGDMIEALIELFSALDADPAIRVVLVRGAGRHFSAGADVNWLNDAYGGDAEPAAGRPPSLVDALRVLNSLAKPTVGLVRGACIGGGLACASCCDMVIASEDAFFSIPEVRIGFSAASVIPFFNAALGARNMRRYGLTGERFDAAAALRMGLVHQICPTGDLDAAAAPIIDALLLGAPAAISETKDIIAQTAGLEITDEIARDLDRRGAAARRSPDAVEGRASFVEKRKPSWYPH